MPDLARRSVLALTASLLLLAAAPAVAQDCLDYSDHYPDLAPTGPRVAAAGTVQAVAVAGSVLCLATDTCVQFWDASDPLAPVWLGEAPVWADRIVAHGDVVYTARYRFGLQAIDISDPTAPAVTEVYRNDRGTFDFLVHANHLFITPNLENPDLWFGITVYDLADPVHPVLVNEVTGGAGFSVCMSGTMMVLANYDPFYANLSFLGGVDLSDPANPVYHTGYVDFAGRTRDIAAFGHHVYAATDTHGLYVIDMSDPDDPLVVRQMPELAGSWSVAVVGQTAWVVVRGGQGDNTLVSLSLADPVSPQLLEGVPFQGNDLYHAEAGGWMYIATDAPGPVLADIADPLLPEVHPWSGAAPGHVELTAVGIAVLDDLVYVGSDVGDPLRILDLSDPQAPLQITSVPGDLLGGDVAVRDTLLFQMVKDPSQPSNRWLDVYSVADPVNPRLLGRGEVGAYTRNLAVTDKAVYSTLNGTIHVMDVRDPANPQYAQALNPPGTGNGSDLLVSGHYLYAPLSSSGLVIYDIANALDPHLAAVVNLPYCIAVDIEGELAYATDYYLGLCIVDIGDPTAPIVLHKEPTLPSARLVEVDGSKLFITSGYFEGWVYDLTEPLAPQLEGEFFAVSGATELDLVGPWLAMGQAGRGLQFAWRACPTTVGAPDEMPRPLPGIAVAPNPFNPRTTITYATTAPGDVQVSVHDLAGRRIAVLVAGWRAAGTHAVSWDGRDERGRAVPSGTYLVRSRSADGVEAVKVSLVR